MEGDYLKYLVQNELKRCDGSAILQGGRLFEEIRSNTVCAFCIEKKKELKIQCLRWPDYFNNSR